MGVKPDLSHHGRIKQTKCSRTGCSGSGVGLKEGTSMARENCIMKSFLYYIRLNDQICHNGMDGTLGTYADEEFMQEFGGETRRKETTWKTWA